MAVKIGDTQAGKLLQEGIAQAEELMKDPGKVDTLLIRLEDYLAEIPTVGETLADIPLMIAMIKAYITKKYDKVSPKVIACLIGAFLYFIKKDDLIKDEIPVLGVADDIAVLALALKVCDVELKEFSAWRDEQSC